MATINLSDMKNKIDNLATQFASIATQFNSLKTTIADEVAKQIKTIGEAGTSFAEVVQARKSSLQSAGDEPYNSLQSRLEGDIYIITSTINANKSEYTANKTTTDAKIKAAENTAASNAKSITNLTSSLSSTNNSLSSAKTKIKDAVNAKIIGVETRTIKGGRIEANTPFTLSTSLTSGYYYAVNGFRALNSSNEAGKHLIIGGVYISGNTLYVYGKNASKDTVYAANWYVQVNLLKFQANTITY